MSSSSVVAALADTEWPGRNQILKHGAVTYFLDGAHTMRSMQACVHWFTEIAAQCERNARWASLPNNMVHVDPCCRVFSPARISQQLRDQHRCKTVCVCYSGSVARVLLFNSTGERDSSAMLKLLAVSQLAVCIHVKTTHYSSCVRQVTHV